MRRLGPTLIALGAGVWVAGVVASVSGVWVTLTPDTARVLVLSLAVVTGGALVGAGALIGRARRTNGSPISSQPLHQPDSLAQLPESDRSGVRPPARGSSSRERVP
jgi:hypothetical protein